MRKTILLAATALGLAGCTAPQEGSVAGLPVPGQPAAQDAGQPDLLVVISVDQLSSELMEEYLPRMSGGLARLANEGTLFINGYQAQSATETCPGHATILTGSLPARSGIVANNWIERERGDEEQSVYCAEDPDRRGEQGARQVISPEHLMVPTLGEYMKSANPAARNVVVGGKDRSAVMLGGRQVDQRWWWGDDGWMTDQTTPAPSVVSAATVSTRNLLDAGSDGFSIPPYCASKPVVTVENRGRIGNDPLGWEPGDLSAFRTTPAYDGAVLALGAALIDEMELGRQDQTDLISLALAATDYNGHKFGPQGGEMCLQLFGLDQNLDGFLKALDARGLDYAVMLTADHGGLTIPERLKLMGNDQAARVDREFGALAAGVLADMGLPETALAGSGDIYIDPALEASVAVELIAALKTAYSAHPQVEGVYSEAEIMALPIPIGDPTEWSILQRLRATHHPARSGDVVIVLKEFIMPIPVPSAGYISTHGSPYEYDRRVPIVFYRPGEAPVRRPDPARTVDILPTLATHLGVSLGGQRIDGECLDGVHGVRCAD
ncbi:alkaline phosphatase family protein [Sphingomicrobium sp. XHP0239]|uniref:alkaline phosphatase family protein n=1 Tax=Sphingomicrobium maritimum TaxID=3133972 RepID=UPI0031CC3989